MQSLDQLVFGGEKTENTHSQYSAHLGSAESLTGFEARFKDCLDRCLSTTQKSLHLIHF